MPIFKRNNKFTISMVKSYIFMEHMATQFRYVKIEYRMLIHYLSKVFEQP